VSDARAFFLGPDGFPNKGIGIISTLERPRLRSLLANALRYSLLSHAEHIFLMSNSFHGHQQILMAYCLGLLLGLGVVCSPEGAARVLFPL
jgi:hypothetical protein